MTVYMIQAGDDDPVKIGHGKYPLRRRDNLQGGSPVKLHLRGVRPGGAAEEQALHKRFRDARLRGEWFKFDAAMLDGFESPPAPRRLRHGALTKMTHPLARYRAERGLTQEALAATLGVTKSTISRIEAATVAPLPELALRIQDLTGIGIADIYRLVKADAAE